MYSGKSAAGVPLRLSCLTAAACLLVCWQYVAGHRARPLRGSLRVLRASGSAAELLQSVAGDLRAGSSSSSCRRSGRRSGSLPGAAPRGIVSGSACAGAAGSAAAAFRAARCGRSGSALAKCGRVSFAASVWLSVRPVSCCCAAPGSLCDPLRGCCSGSVCAGSARAAAAGAGAPLLPSGSVPGIGAELLPVRSVRPEPLQGSSAAA